MDWGNNWWEDSYNSALQAGGSKKRKKSKNSLQKMKKAKTGSGSEDSGSDSDDSGSDSGSGEDSEDEKAAASKKEAAPAAIVSQQEHLFAIGQKSPAALPLSSLSSHSYCVYLSLPP
jgi:hypothetical protein